MHVSLPEFIKPVLGAVLNRKFMVLLAGIAVVVFLISYLVLPRSMEQAVQPYLLFVMAIGLGGALVNWGLDADKVFAHKKLRGKIKTYLFSPDPKCINILMGFLNQKTSVVVTWPWANGIPQLLRAGIIEEPKEAMSDGMRAYLLTKMAQGCIKKHEKELHRAWSKASSLKPGS
jgi:hypothetical protein